MTFSSPRKVRHDDVNENRCEWRKTSFCWIENEEDFDFIDPSILLQFERNTISIEKIQKEIFNFDDKGGKFLYLFVVI